MRAANAANLTRHEGPISLASFLPTELIRYEMTITKPPLDIAALLKQHAGRNYELHAAHVNPANVRTLRTIGFDRCYVRAEGPYLWDIEGTKYLDLLSGYGVFSLGRNHPDVRKVLADFCRPNTRAL